MNYQKYKSSRDMAWQILIHEKVHELPVKIVKLCHGLGISVRLFEGAGDGFSTMLNGQPFIFVNKNTPKPRQRFTIAHELGHIMLGHLGKYPLVNREPSPADNPIEHEANVFAARLLAPACVLHELRAFSVEQIMAVCEISRPAAQFRLDRLLLLEEREKIFRKARGHGCFYLSPLEKKLGQQFKKYIREINQSSSLASGKEESRS